MGRENIYRKFYITIGITKAGGRHLNKNAGVPSVNQFPACTNGLRNDQHVQFSFFCVVLKAVTKSGLHPLPLSLCFPPKVGLHKDKLHFKM